MVFHVLADATVIFHAAFVAFAVGGGLFVAWWPRIAWVHLPAAAWGAWVEFAGWVCPLTPLENWLRSQGGGTAYGSSFIEHYLLPILYPSSLSRELQYVLGGLVLLVNAVVYAVVVRRRVRCTMLSTNATRRFAVHRSARSSSSPERRLDPRQQPE